MRFDGGLEEDDGGGAVDVVIAVDQNLFAAARDGLLNALYRGAHAQEERRIMQVGERWLQELRRRLRTDSTGGQHFGDGPRTPDRLPQRLCSCRMGVVESPAGCGHVVSCRVQRANPDAFRARAAEDMGRSERVVPQQAVAFVGYQKRHAETGSGRSLVISPAANRMAAMVEKSLVVLAQAVVVLVVGGAKGRSNHVELRISGTAVLGHGCRTVLVIGHGLGPCGEFQQRLALRRAQRDVRARSGAVEVFLDVHLGLQQRMDGREVLVHDGDNSWRPINIGSLGLARAPACSRRQAANTVTRRSQRGLAIQAERYAQNIGRVRFQHNRFSLAVEFEPLGRRLREGACVGQDDSGKHGNYGGKPLHEILHRRCKRPGKTPRSQV